MKKFIFLAALCATLGGCGHYTYIEKKSCPPAQQPVIASREMAMTPKATIFRMAPEMADKVAVNVNQDGSLTYFPAPSDISAQSSPLPLGGGWYLNRQGISAGARFTKWTFKEYAALTSTPSPSEILKSLVPGQGVTDFTTLPISIWEALENPGKCKELLPKK